MAARRFSKTGSITKSSRRRAAAPKPKGDPTAAIGVILVLAGILLLVVGACMFLFNVRYAGEREPMLLGGALAGILGVAAISVYFHKWGDL